MRSSDAELHARVLLSLLQRLGADQHLAAELQRARRQFFPAAEPTAAAECRFAEWFVLERDSEVLGCVPQATSGLAAECQPFQGSLVGAFLVTSTGGETVLARDLQDQSMLELRVPVGSLLAGDLLVGRLFAARGGLLPSVAAAVFRPGQALAAAFAADLQRLDLERRLQQVELEQLLLQRRDQQRSPTAAKAVHPEHLEAELDRLLRSGGSQDSATAISERLAAAARPGAVLGPLLDSLAFDSTVDLEAARRVLLELWNALHPEGEPAAATAPALPPGLSLGEELVQRLDAGLAAQRDVEDVFAELERIAGIDPEEAEEDTGLDPGGDLGPLVQEYLWEHNLADDSAAGRTLAKLVQLQENSPVPRPDLEQTTSADLERWLLHIYLAAPAKERAAAVHAAHALLQAFLAWAAEVQQVPALAQLAAAAELPLLDQLERLAAASAELSSPVVPGLRPALFEVDMVAAAKGVADPQGVGGQHGLAGEYDRSFGFALQNDDGEQHWIVCAAATAARLQAGDVVVAAVRQQDGKAALQGPVVVLPASARNFLE